METCYLAEVRVPFKISNCFVRYIEGYKINFLPRTKINCNIFTSAKEVMFSPGFVCEFVCAFVNKITQKLMTGF